MASQLLDAPDLSASHFRELSPETVDRSYQHLDRCRRIRVGPALTLVFENQRTLWFRMQELAGCTRRSPDDDVRRLNDWYRRLMPSEDRLLAALWVAVPGRRAILNLENLREVVSGSRLILRSATGYEIEGALLDERVRDRLIGLVGWVEFPFGLEDRLALETPRQKWRLAIESDDYRYESEPLSPLVLMSLLADLGVAA